MNRQYYQNVMYGYPFFIRPVKELAKELKMPLFIIFRKSLDTGILLKVWKIANVSSRRRRWVMSSIARFLNALVLFVEYPFLCTAYTATGLIIIAKPQMASSQSQKSKKPFLTHNKHLNMRFSILRMRVSDV